MAEIEFLSPYSVPILLLGERELPLVFDATTTVWISKLGDKFGNRVFVTFENSKATPELTAEKLQTFFSARWVSFFECGFRDLSI